LPWIQCDVIIDRDQRSSGKAQGIDAPSEQADSVLDATAERDRLASISEAVRIAAAKSIAAA
jgi:hypothetical protein